MANGGIARKAIKNQHINRKGSSSESFWPQQVAKSGLLVAANNATYFATLSIRLYAQNSVHWTNNIAKKHMYIMSLKLNIILS